MTKKQYEEVLGRADISQEDLKRFLSYVLTVEENTLSYVDHVRAFIWKRKRWHTSGNIEALHEIQNAILRKLFGHRTPAGISGRVIDIERFLPRPSEESINIARGYYEKYNKDFFAKSEYRRGFYRKGEPTYDCGKGYKSMVKIK